MERRDQLIPLDERQFKGAYYTPLKVVDKAYDLLAETLGKNWQKNYIVWDMCCGVGNLETKHGNLRNVFMSTLDEADIKVMKTSGQFPAVEPFQYDYLNDDIAEDGTIDYMLTGKMPPELREIIQAACTDKKKKILVLINPPYAEATSSFSATGGQDKSGVARTKMVDIAKEKFGKASNDLYTQFLSRIALELPNAVVAVFSTLKYVVAPTLQDFRENWHAEFKNGFVVHSKSFDGLNENFPIGFLIWQMKQNQPKIKFPNEIQTAVLNNKVEPAGEKIFSGSLNLLTDWVERPPTNDTPVVPLKNAIVPATATKDLRGDKWSDGAVAYLNCAGNDLQNAGNKTMVYSSGYGSARGFFVNQDNLKKPP